MSKLLTVFGATGNQGGSVIKAVLANPKLSSVYRLRGVTRDVSKPAARALAQKGVEVVQGDINDKDALRTVLAGSSAVFAVTNYWEKASKESEYTQGTNIANIAGEIGVEHLIWSSLPHVTKMTGGKLSHVLHFDSKAEVEEYIRAEKIPATFFEPAFFMQNTKGMIRAGEDGNYTWVSPFHPDTKIPMLDVVDDSGKFVAAALLQGPSPEPKRILGVSQWISPTEVGAVIEEVSGKKYTYQECDAETFMKFLPPATAKELTENFLLIRDYEYFGPGGQVESKASMDLVEDLTSYKQWAEKAGF